MSDIHAVRTESHKFEAWIHYESILDSNKLQFDIQENTNLVDGIGGVTWVSGTLPVVYTTVLG
jgi:hypothetical protein